MTREWTPAQHRAILADNGNLLVCAGAGSGKSTVLVERIMQHITRENNPVMLDRMLVLTFSIASAADLRSKIASELSDRIAANPDNTLLLRQKELLPTAQISTIDSFFYSILERYKFELGIPASAHIFDEAEVSKLMRESMEDTVDIIHSGHADVSTEAYTAIGKDFFGYSEYEGQPIISLYNKLQSLTDGIESLKTESEGLDKVNDDGFFATAYGRQIKKICLDFFTHYQTAYAEALELWAKFEKTRNNYYVPFDEEFSHINTILAELNRESISYSKVRELILEIKSKKGTLGRSKKGDEPDEQLQTYYKKSVREKYHTQSESILKTYFILPADKLSEICANTYGKVEVIYRTLKLYDSVLNTNKNRIGMLTFSDVTRYVLQLVYAGGEKTDTAKDIASRFDEVYIDEYQDVSPIQDRIICCVSPDNSRFMVGDIKQCIYAFRNSDPALFAQYRREYRDYEDGYKGDIKIFLSDNFRCAERIINTVNKVFSKLFNITDGVISYSHEDELNYRETPKNQSEAPVRIIIGNTGEVESDAITVYEVEKMISSGVKPEDILILCRTVSKCTQVCNALAEKGIRTNCEIRRALFEEDEIQTAVSLLRVIDEPDNDIAVAAVLMSPLYSMTLDELTDIRLGFSRKEKLINVIKQSDNPVAVSFVDDIENLRKQSYGMPSDELLTYIYDEYGLREKLLLARPERAATAQSNFTMLYNLARNCEANSYKGLYRFLCNIETLARENSSVEGGASPFGVNVMSIHKSKGLEYKHVIIPYAESKLYSVTKSRNGIMFNSKLGIGLTDRAKNGFVRFTTPLTSAVVEANMQKELDEEMRLLYVAMTRAEQSLTVIGTVTNTDAFIPDTRLKCRSYDRHTLIKDNCYLSWICSSLLSSEPCSDYSITFFSPTENEESEIVQSQDNTDEEKAEILARKIKERISFRYPFEKMTKIPAKLTVSKLSPGILDELDESGMIESKGEYHLKKPVFDKNGRRDGAFTGTATHLFMQFCNFENAEKYGIESEISRLVKDRFIDSDTAEAISRKNIEDFLTSPVYNEMKTATFIEREMRFNALLPASDFTESEEERALLDSEQILVQGVIDCIFRNSDGNLVLLDYKTDSSFGKDESEFVNILKKRHSTQLTYYRKAVESLFSEKVCSTLIYSFALGKSIEIN